MSEKTAPTRVVFVTGSEQKAQYFSRVAGIPVSHKKVDLDEIQSLDLKRIVSDKVRRAFDVLRTPVIVEDVSLEIDALNGLPGPLIKWFVDKLSLLAIC